MLANRGGSELRAQFLDRDGSRVYPTDLRIPDGRDRLRAIWTNPMSLDPSRRRVRVTREIAALPAKLATEMEARKHTSVAAFLMQSVSSMFAQSVGLVPGKTAFTDLLVLRNIRMIQPVGPRRSQARGAVWTT